MTDWLTAPVVPLAWCWRIVRRDGVTLGFTTHDAALLIDDQLYDPAPGIRPSAIEQGGALDGDVFDIEGALSGVAISEADLAAGRWDDAALTLFVANWQDLALERVVIANGRIGTVSSDGHEFSATLGSADAMLDEPIVPETSAECRAELGDAQCRVAVAGRQHAARIVAVDGPVMTMSGSWADGLFDFGDLRILSGPGRGLRLAIIRQTGDRCHVAVRHGITLAAGTTVELTEGCDKRAATCTNRFSNIANFRGEPHLPGLDLLTRFPGG